MRLGIRTLLWKREKIARRMLQHYADMVGPLASEGIELVLLAVASAGGGNSAGECGWISIYTSNKPLSQKCGAGVRKLRDYGVDAVLCLGCDDFISMESIKGIRSELRAGADLIGWETGYIVHADHGMMFWPGYPKDGPRAGEPFGPGKTYSKRLLDALDWDPWKGVTTERNLDGMIWERIQTALPDAKLRILPADVLGPIVDVKDEGSMSPWIGTQGRAPYNTPVPLPEALQILDHVGLGDLLPPADIHPTAVVDSSAKLGVGVTIGAFSYIGAFAEIGAFSTIGRYCEIRENCVVGERVSMGSRCTLSAGTTVGGGALLRYGFVACDKPGFDGEPIKRCMVGDDVNVGANVTLMPGVLLGQGCTIGACSQVRHDVPAGETWYGNPARRHR